MSTYSFVPSLKNEKRAEIRENWVTTQLLTFQPGLTPDTLPLDLEAALAEFVTTEYCPKLLKDDYLKSKEESEEPEEVEPLLPDPEPMNPKDIQQEPYMAGLGAKLTTVDINNINCVTEEEEMRENGDITEASYSHLETDLKEDWARDRVQLGLSATQISDAGKWLEVTQASTPMVDEVWKEQYSCEDLNIEQREVYEAVLGYLVEEMVEQSPLIDVSGGAGTGKTRLLRTILQQAEALSGSRERIKVCAFTNNAAGQFVGGVTVHRLLRLDVDRSGRPQFRNQNELDGERLASLQDEFSNTLAVIIDEKSMIGCFMLWCIDQRLRQAKPQSAHLPFGGLLVLLCGDMSQLPPVGDKPLYASSGQKTAKQQLGYALYRLFTESYQLKTSMRQQGEANEEFRQELGRLADGSFTLADWQHWSSRELATLPEEERERFLTGGVKLCSRKQDMVTFNEAGLRRTGNPILMLKALHNNSTARNASESKGQFPALLPVARGASVVLTSNLWPQAKLLNGSRGTVTYIVYEEGKGPEDGLPAFLVVTFPLYTGPPYIPDEPGTVAICSRLADWMERRTRCLRRMYPLILGYSITIHKCQGRLSERKRNYSYVDRIVDKIAEGTAHIVGLETNTVLNKLVGWALSL